MTDQITITEFMEYVDSDCLETRELAEMAATRLPDSEPLKRVANRLVTALDAFDAALESIDD